MICCFLTNISAKNYPNWIVYVKIIASQRWDVSSDTVQYYQRLLLDVDNHVWKDFAAKPFCCGRCERSVILWVAQ